MKSSPVEGTPRHASAAAVASSEAACITECIAAMSLLTVSARIGGRVSTR
jgi:hypothetical protein